MRPVRDTSLVVGLFLTAMGTLMLEILLTRIFSVTMWYHFAFMAVSIAMFGLTAGALLVQLLPRAFPRERTRERLVEGSILFVTTTVVCFLTHLTIRVAPDDVSVGGVLARVAAYGLVAIPFVASGIVICLVLTRYPARVGRLYAADLVGGSLGCLSIPLLFKITGDGPTAVIVVASLPALAAVAFAIDTRTAHGRVPAIESRTAHGGVPTIDVGASTVPSGVSDDRGRSSLTVEAVDRVGSSRRTAAVALAAVLVLGSLPLILAARAGHPLISLRWVKGHQEEPALWERWSSYARVQVTGDAEEAEIPFGWGWSERTPVVPVHQLHLTIDATAGTVLTRFDGDVAQLEYLSYDLSNLGQVMRPDGKIAVIGAGGGRDVLSSLVFDQKEIVAIEINSEILEAVNRRFGDFTGHLDRDPRVHFVNAEARSWLTRTPERYDLIMASLIDTWAATAAGAFVLTENTLYTVEAWSTFFERLNPGGMLSFSRWYIEKLPAEILRLTCVAAEALERRGVTDPAQHIAVVVATRGSVQSSQVGFATLLASPTPWSEKDIARLEEACQFLGFTILHSPKHSNDSGLARMLSPDREQFLAEHFLDLSAPTDDRPFFFQMLRLRDAFSPGVAAARYEESFGSNVRAVSVLGTMLGMVALLSGVCLAAPFLLAKPRPSIRASWPGIIYFTAIGLGYLLVEVSLLQRLTVYLGHPTYSLSVVLFTLLLSSGVGSFLSTKLARGARRHGKESTGAPHLAPESIEAPHRRRAPSLELGLVLGVLVLQGALMMPVLEATRGAANWTRVAVAVALIFPPGLLMGMPFPLGLTAASERQETHLPWFWAVNGAASITASVLAIVIALVAGISASFWAGVGCYAIAIAGFARLSRG